MCTQPMLYKHSNSCRSSCKPHITKCHLSSATIKSESIKRVHYQTVPLSVPSPVLTYTNPLLSIALTIVCIGNVRLFQKNRPLLSICYSRSCLNLLIICATVSIFVTIRPAIVRQVTFELMSSSWTNWSRQSRLVNCSIHYSSGFSHLTQPRKRPLPVRVRSNQIDRPLPFGLLFTPPYRNPRLGLSSRFVQVISMFLLLSYGFTVTQATQLSSVASNTPDTNHVPIDAPVDSGSVWSEQIKAHCIDSNGTMHGLFSTWTEYPDCHCTCYPNARMAVSVCDGCVVDMPSADKHNGLDPFNPAERKPIPRSGDRVGHVRMADQQFRSPMKSEGGLELDERRENTKDFRKHRGCVYKQTGAQYRHGEIWMSAEMPCVKCHCQDQTISCTGEPHHCPPICLPGQQTLGPGSCCETTCRGPPLGNLSTNFSDCVITPTGMRHRHGELVTLPGSCVDQKCLCVNGRWHCLDYCIPMEHLPCPKTDVILWDPFCCPRCPGNETCSVQTVLAQSHSERTHSIDHTRLRLDGTIDDADVSSNQITGEDTSLTQPDRWGQGQTSPPALTVIDPGRGVALPQGRCYCVNGTMHCARPGRHIWHDQDCYFVDRLETAYYPLEARWTPAADPCTECRCLTNQTYTCAPKRCARTFLCPQGQQPLIRRGECCPSYCGVSPTMDNDEDSEKPNTLSSWSASNPIPLRPPSLGQLQTKPATSSKDKQTERQQHPPYSNQDQLKNEDQAHLLPRPRVGCRPWDGSEVHPTNRFPPGSRLVLTRPCRSLLCVCARDDRWLCTDHCPPCVRSFEAIENMREVPRPPPPGRCCPPCDNTDQSISKKLDVQGKPHGPESNLYPLYDPDSPVWGRPEDNAAIDRNRHQPLSSDYAPGYPSPYRVPYRSDLAERYDNATHEHIKRTLRLYVLIAGLVLFCLFGFPLIVFFAWQLIRRRRKRERHEYRVKLQRRRQNLAAMASAVRKRPGYIVNTQRVKHSLSSESPQTSYSHKNDTSPTYASSKEPQSQSTGEPINAHSDRVKSELADSCGWAGDSLRTGTFETNETELSVLNASTEVAVHKLPQSVPVTPIATHNTNPYAEDCRHTGNSPFLNGRPTRVRSVLKPASTSIVSKDHTTSSSTPYFPEAYHVKIESPRTGLHSRMAVRRTQSNVSNKERAAKPKTRVALNRASTWLGNTRPVSPIVGCFSRNSFRRTEQSEPSPSNRSIKLARIRRSNGLVSSPSTPSSSTMSEQADVFFGSDSPPFAYPSPPDSATRSPKSMRLDYAPTPYVAPGSTNASREVTVPSPTRTHHFVHLNRPVTPRPQTNNTNQTNGYELKDSDYRGSNLSKPDPETDPSVSMSDSQTPLLTIHRAHSNITTPNTTPRQTTTTTETDLGRITTSTSKSSSQPAESVANRVQLTGTAVEPTQTYDKPQTNHSLEPIERVIVIDSGKPRSQSQQPEPPTGTGTDWNPDQNEKSSEMTFTWPRSTRQPSTAEPVTSTPLSPSTSLNSQPAYP